jgi:hypothetical protein
VLALITNWVRVFIIVVVGHVTEMQHYLVAKEHYSFGWFMFVGTMTVYFLISRRWPAGAEVGDSAPVQENSTTVSRGAVVLVLAALCAAPAWGYLRSATRLSTSPAEPLPADSPRWTRSNVESHEWQPVFVGADREVNAVFSSGTERVETYGAVYLRQYQGKELVGYGNSVYGNGLTPQRDRQPSRAPWAASRAIDRRGDSWLLWHAYRVDGDWQSRSLILQLNYALRSLFGSPQASVVILRARCEGQDCSGANAALENFVSIGWMQDRSAG